MADAKAMGFILPTDNDYISGGDDAIARNAQVTADQLETRDWTRPPIASTAPVDIDTVLTPGFYAVMAAASPNLPEAVTGVLEVFRLGSGAARTQRFTPYRNGAAPYQRHRAGSGAWNAWTILTASAPISVAAGTDLNTITTPGTYDVNATMTNWPVAQGGALEVLKIGSAAFQRYTAWLPRPRVFIRSSIVGNTEWRPWAELAYLDTVQPVTPQPAAGAGYKSAALALTQTGGGGTETISAASVRWPVKIGVTALRARLHVRNLNWGSGNGYPYPGAVSFTGAWVGPGNGKDFTGAPQRVLPAFTTAADASEYVSPWFDYDFTEDAQHLFSVGFTTAAGQTNFAGRGGCWRTTNPADASALSPAAEQSITSPFDVWLELEVPEATPILAGFGDSNTVGTGTTLPVYDSWLAEYCRRQRAMPFHLAIHGSAASTWADAAAPKWNRYPGTARPDAAVYFLHQNDLADGITLAELQARFRSTVAILKSKLTPNVYGATITPRNAPEAIDSVRRAYNDWLNTRPEGLRGCFNFSAAISDDDRTVRAADSADGLHFTTSGHAKIAAVLEARPVTPRVLTRREIARLTA